MSSPIESFTPIVFYDDNNPNRTTLASDPYISAAYFNAREVMLRTLIDRILSLEGNALTSEAVQDIVGALLQNAGNVDFTYSDTTGAITANVTIPVSSVAGRTGAIVLAKADVNLTNVDNTSDVNKPVSTATSTALATKANTTDVRFTDARAWTLYSGTASSGQVPQWNGTAFVPTTPASGTGGTSYTDEQAQDVAAALLTTGTHSGISFAYDDSTAKVNATVTGGGGTGTAYQGPPGLVWRGTYSGTTTYAQNDAVYYAPSSYIAIVGTTGVVPTDTTRWNLLARGV